MEPIINILEDICSQAAPASCWTLILTAKGSCNGLIEGKAFEHGKGITIIPADMSWGNLSCSQDFDGGIIQIPESIVTDSDSPVSEDFIRKVRETPWLDLSAGSSRDDLKMASNYWFLIKEALHDDISPYAKSEAMNLGIALIKFCEKHYQ